MSAGIEMVDRLIAKAEGKEEIEVAGEKWNFSPLNNKEVLKFISLAEKGNVENMMLSLIEMTLAKDIPEITREKVEKMPYLFDFIIAIAKLNHLERFFPNLFQQGSVEFPEKKPLMSNVQGSIVKGRVDLSQHN